MRGLSPCRLTAFRWRSSPLCESCGVLDTLQGYRTALESGYVGIDRAGHSLRRYRLLLWLDGRPLSSRKSNDGDPLHHRPLFNRASLRTVIDVKKFPRPRSNDVLLV